MRACLVDSSTGPLRANRVFGPVFRARLLSQGDGRFLGVSVFRHPLAEAGHIGSDYPSPYRLCRLLFKPIKTTVILIRNPWQKPKLTDSIDSIIVYYLLISESPIRERVPTERAIKVSCAVYKDHIVSHQLPIKLIPSVNQVHYQVYRIIMSDNLRPFIPMSENSPLAYNYLRQLTDL